MPGYAYFEAGKTHAYIYDIHGEASQKLLDELLAQNEKKLGKHGSVSLRKQKIGGIEKPVKFSITQGIKTTIDSTHSTFHTFWDAEKKPGMIENMQPNQQLALTIYVSRPHPLKYRPAIRTAEENLLVVKYFEALIAQ